MEPHELPRHRHRALRLPLRRARAPESTSARSRRSGRGWTRGSRALGAAPIELAEAEPPEHVPADRHAPAARAPPTARRSSSRRSASRGSSRSTPTSASTPASSTSGSASPSASSSAGSPSRTWSRRPARWRSPGLLPVVHSFACFLSTRPNEQIYNNATEGTKVHLRRLARRASCRAGRATRTSPSATSPRSAAMPGMALIEPFCESEVRAAVDWAVQRARGAGLPAARQRAVGARLRPAGDRRARARAGNRAPAAGRRALRRRRAGDGRGRLARGRPARRRRGRGGRRRAPLAARRRRRLAGRGRRRRARSSRSTTTTSPAGRATRCSPRSPPTLRRRRLARAPDRRRPRSRRAARTTRCFARHGLDAEGIAASVGLRLQALEPSA